MVRGSGGSHQSAQTGRNADHEHLRDGNVEPVGVGDGDEGHHGRSDGRASDTYLRGDGSHAAGTLRTDAFLDGNVADDRHQRVDHVSGSNEHRQEESAERSQEGDAVGMLAEHLLGNLNQPVHAARCLHDASTGDGSDDDVDYVGGWRTWFHSETEN